MNGTASHPNDPTVSTTKLIYNTKAQKQKYQVQIYRFKLLFRPATIDLYLSDLNHQALLLANLNNANESNGRYAPRIVFTDQPSLFDFKFVRLTGDCETDEPVGSTERLGVTGVQLVDEKANEQTNERVDQTSDRSMLYAKVERNDEKDVLSEQLSKEVTSELSNVLIGISRGELSDELGGTQANFCFTCMPNLVYLIVYSVLAVVLVSLVALAVVFLSKRRYNTLIGEDPSGCTFKRKLNNIQFNIKKTMQTM